jgi:hypothetical protein
MEHAWVHGIIVSEMALRITGTFGILILFDSCTSGNLLESCIHRRQLENVKTLVLEFAVDPEAMSECDE